jgi:hypothetical protein
MAEEPEHKRLTESKRLARDVGSGIALRLSAAISSTLRVAWSRRIPGLGAPLTLLLETSSGDALDGKYAADCDVNADPTSDSTGLVGGATAVVDYR